MGSRHRISDFSGLSRLRTGSGFAGRPARNLAVKVVHRTIDQLSHRVGLVVGFFEFFPVGVRLIQGHVQMTLDLFAGSEGDVEQPALVFE